MLWWSRRGRFGTHKPTNPNLDFYNLIKRRFYHRCNNYWDINLEQYTKQRFMNFCSFLLRVLHLLSSFAICTASLALSVTLNLCTWSPLSAINVLLWYSCKFSHRVWMSATAPVWKIKQKNEKVQSSLRNKFLEIWVKAKTSISWGGGWGENPSGWC